MLHAAPRDTDEQSFTSQDQSDYLMSLQELSKEEMLIKVMCKLADQYRLTLYSICPYPVEERDGRPNSPWGL